MIISFEGIQGCGKKRANNDTGIYVVLGGE